MHHLFGRNQRGSHPASSRPPPAQECRSAVHSSPGASPAGQGIRAHKSSAPVARQRIRMHTLSALGQVSTTCMMAEPGGRAQQQTAPAERAAGSAQDVAPDETVILQPPVPLLDVSIGISRGCRQNDSLDRRLAQNARPECARRRRLPRCAWRSRLSRRRDCHFTGTPSPTKY